MPLDGTQIVLAIIAIITALIGVIATILAGVGTATFFIVKYFIQEIKDIRDLWRKDQATWFELIQSYADTLPDIAKMTGEHTGLMKAIFEMLEEHQKTSETNFSNLTHLAALAAKTTRKRE